MEYIQDLILDVNSNTAYTTIGAKQGDSEARKVRIYLTRGGDSYSLDTENAVAYFRFRKPDGKVIINAAQIVSYDPAIIDIQFTAQTLTAAGRGYADIVLQQGSAILSTVSFIIIVMASPQIANEVESSNEFGFLNAVIGDATNVISSAEAWATGNRDGVAGPTNYFNLTVGPQPGTTLSSATTVDQAGFMSAVGNAPGLYRDYKFTYLENGAWNLTDVIQNGTAYSSDSPQVISDGVLSDTYKVTVGYIPGAQPSVGNWINIHVEETDITYQNNAKYYAEVAAASVATLGKVLRYDEQSLSTIEQEQARININAQVSGNYIADPSIKAANQYLVYSADSWQAMSLPDFISNPSNKTNGQYLTYNGSAWQATTLPTYIADPSVKTTGQILSYSSAGWYAATYSADNVNAIPSILDSRYYGDNLPANPTTGQIFFKKYVEEE